MVSTLHIKANVRVYMYIYIYTPGVVKTQTPPRSVLPWRTITRLSLRGNFSLNSDQLDLVIYCSYRLPDVNFVTEANRKKNTTNTVSRLGPRWHANGWWQPFPETTVPEWPTSNVQQMLLNFGEKKHRDFYQTIKPEQVLPGNLRNIVRQAHREWCPVVLEPVPARGIRRKLFLSSTVPEGLFRMSSHDPGMFKTSFVKEEEWRSLKRIYVYERIPSNLIFSFMFLSDGSNYFLLFPSRDGRQRKAGEHRPGETGKRPGRTRRGSWTHKKPPKKNQSLWTSTSFVAIHNLYVSEKQAGTRIHRKMS